MDIRPISSNAQAAAARGGVQAGPARERDATADARDVAAPAGAAPGKEELAAALKSINIALQERTPGLEFAIDTDSGRAIVKIVDKDTQEVIRQMPSREALDIARAIGKLQGLMGKQTA